MAKKTSTFTGIVIAGTRVFRGLWWIDNRKRLASWNADSPFGPRSFLNRALSDFPYCFNRDARVNATDMLIARDNQTHFLNALKLIAVPEGKAEAKVEQTLGYDAAFAQAVGQEGTPLSKLAWLYEWEMDAQERPTKNGAPAGPSVDDLLATSWF